MKIIKRVNNVIINLEHKEIIKMSDILKYANKCRSTYGYFKISMYNNRYLVVVYNKDNTIFLMSNYRSLQMFTEIDTIMRTYTQDRVVKFMFRWMNILTK